MSISRDRRSAIGSFDDLHADPPSHEFGNIADTARRKKYPPVLCASHEIEIYFWTLEGIQCNLGGRITARLGIREGIAFRKPFEERC